MSNVISLTVPLQAMALVRASEYLQALADDLAVTPAAEPAAAELGNDSAPTVTGQDGGPSAPTSDAAGDVSSVDCKGVPFDPEYCGVATDPFYSSGKREGQWKKKRGISEDEYDEWYARQLPPAEAEPRDPASSAAAFTPAQPPAQSAAQPTGPQETGAFMGWISEKQTAGLLTQDDVQAAYSQAGVQVTDLFPPNAPAAVAEKLQALYGILAQKAGA